MTARKPRLGDEVALHWLDAWCDHDTSTERDWKDAYPVTTYGVLRRLKPVVTVVSEPGLDDEGRCTTHVPLAMVQRIDVLRRPKQVP
jgi:hypothetical protein